MDFQPSGKFIIGGPQGDDGFTRRKIIIHTYGGWCTQVELDRSAVYICRQMAKSVVKSGLTWSPRQLDVGAGDQGMFGYVGDAPENIIPLTRSMDWDMAVGIWRWFLLLVAAFFGLRLRTLSPSGFQVVAFSLPISHPSDVDIHTVVSLCQQQQ